MKLKFNLFFEYLDDVKKIDDFHSMLLLALKLLSSSIVHIDKFKNHVLKLQVFKLPQINNNKINGLTKQRRNLCANFKAPLCMMPFRRVF